MDFRPSTDHSTVERQAYNDLPVHFLIIPFYFSFVNGFQHIFSVFSLCFAVIIRRGHEYNSLNIKSIRNGEEMNDAINITLGKKDKRAGNQTNIPSVSCGLSGDEVESSRKKYGSNAISRGKRAGFLRQFVVNLNDPIIKILIAALVINTAFTFSHINWAETIGIAVTVFISAFVTTVSEHSSCTAGLRTQRLR